MPALPSVGGLRGLRGLRIWKMTRRDRCGKEREKTNGEMPSRAQTKNSPLQEGLDWGC
jgi:hypothetical protein